MILAAAAGVAVVVIDSFFCCKDIKVKDWTTSVVRKHRNHGFI